MSWKTCHDETRVWPSCADCFQSLQSGLWWTGTKSVEMPTAPRRAAVCVETKNPKPLEYRDRCSASWKQMTHGMEKPPHHRQTQRERVKSQLHWADKIPINFKEAVCSSVSPSCLWGAKGVPAWLTMETQLQYNNDSIYYRRMNDRQICWNLNLWFQLS